MENWLGLIGLILDIIGFYLLYNYGLLAELNKSILNKKELRKQNTLTETKKMKYVVNLSSLGFWLVLFGFIFQSTPTIIKLTAGNSKNESHNKNNNDKPKCCH
ncbi:MAG TPA: hypothetical protein VN026_04615 [Bacteroidia bacterium]|nr:hypothetical protein [Bacteroidia bacterium]